jgi:hypothetical protein
MNKTEEDYAIIAKSEWMAGLYWDKVLGVYVPGQSIQSSIWGGAKLHKLGKKIQRGVMVTEEKVKLIYDGPTSPSDLWMAKDGSGDDERWTYRDARSVIVGAARLMRYRPRFDVWSVDLVIEYDTNMIDEHELMTSADSAGRYIGIGDFRRDKGGMFGCFSVKY